MNNTEAALVQEFIKNVNQVGAHLEVISSAKILLGRDNNVFPVAHDPAIFFACIVGYLESVEEYELCGRLIKNKKKVLKRLVPMDDHYKKVLASFKDLFDDLI